MWFPEDIGWKTRIIYWILTPIAACYFFVLKLFGGNERY